VLIRVKQFGNGQELARRLEDNNIITNYQALPDDTTFLESSGLRLGVQEMTRFGMKKKEFRDSGCLIAEVVRKNKTVKDEVKRYRQNFLEMQYCLPEKEAVELAANLFLSLFPARGVGQKLVENLASKVKEQAG